MTSTDTSVVIHVTIRTFDGKCRPMDIDTADTVFNVTTIMSKQIERKPEDLMMVFDGCILEDEKRIQDCGIRRGSQVNLIQRYKNHKTSLLKRKNSYLMR
ncbi:uncharacterized protein LOC131736357 [Acipenser ruthenus]|uniref:uncharacterized protein LOC131736357 n=1 Tax=Acipenser ruthenus TaxID=7906 RepID=UPI00145A6DF3|nr:uncharacterized protein LOC131736357 [Acipenser ruthenus]